MTSVTISESGSWSPAAAAVAAQRWEGMDLREILTEASSLFDGRLGILSALGPATLVVIHTAVEMGLRLPVIFIDTLHHFPETMDLVSRVEKRYSIEMRIVRPAANREEFEARYGPRLWERDLELYQRVSKVEPCERATIGLDAWITGRRRQQAETRADLPVLETGEKFRINPLATWSREDVWRFILERDIPYNALHDRGYSSIGDEPLTTPARPGEHERAGRWRGLDRTECGIHGP